MNEYGKKTQNIKENRTFTPEQFDIVVKCTGFMGDDDTVLSVLIDDLQRNLDTGDLYCEYNDVEDNGYKDVGQNTATELYDIFDGNQYDLEVVAASKSKVVFKAMGLEYQDTQSAYYDEDYHETTNLIHTTIPKNKYMPRDYKKGMIIPNVGVAYVTNCKKPYFSLHQIVKEII